MTGSDTGYSEASDAAAPLFLAGEADRLALLRAERERERERLAERLRDLQHKHNTSTTDVHRHNTSTIDVPYVDTTQQFHDIQHLHCYNSLKEHR